MTIACRVCRASGDAMLCKPCTRILTDTLKALPADLRDLQLVATRQAIGPLGLGVGHFGERQSRKHPWEALGPHAEGSLGEAPWDFAPGAADQIWAAGNTITTWIRHLCEMHRLAPPIATRGTYGRHREFYVDRNRMHVRWLRVFLPSSDQPLGPLVDWLLDNTDAIRHDEAAEQIYDEFIGLHAENERWTLGRSGIELFAGRCDSTQVGFEEQFQLYVDRNRMYAEWLLAPVAAVCGVDLYGNEGETHVRCKACGTKYPLADRLADVHDRQINDQLARAHVIADALTTLEKPLGRDRLRKWIQRDTLRSSAQDGPACEECEHATCRSIRRPPIHAKSIDDEGHPLYRVGDVRRRLDRLADRKSSGETPYRPVMVA